MKLRLLPAAALVGISLLAVSVVGCGGSNAVPTPAATTQQNDNRGIVGTDRGTGVSDTRGVVATDSADGGDQSGKTRGILLGD